LKAEIQQRRTGSRIALGASDAEHGFVLPGE
jgi:hypothetical protein